MRDNPLARTHIESNRQSRAAWERFASHRARVTALVLDLLAPGGRVGVVGAGNVNDLDLGQVLAVAGDVDLVDLDGEAMAEALHRHDLQSDHRIRLHGGCDVSGLLDAAPGEADERNLAAAIDNHALPLIAETYDVVLSAGVLTQLFQSVAEYGLDPDATIALTLRMRDHHLTELTRLVRRGGHAILVTDTVATSTAPRLHEVAEDELEPAMAALVADSNFFTGTNPYRVVAVLEEGTPFAGLIAEVRLHDPWLWAVTPDREHLTYAITWRRQR